MKKVVVVLFLLFCMYVPANAANFVEIIRDDSALVYVDVDSIREDRTFSDEYFVAVIKLIPSGDATEESLKWVPEDDNTREFSNEYRKYIGRIMYLYALNKNKKQIQVMTYYLYDKKDYMMTFSTWFFKVNDYQEVLPRTYDNSIYDFILNYYNENK